MHLDALYERDAQGRIVACRDPAVPVPRVHLLRTAEGNRWLLRADMGEEQRARLEAVLRAQPVAGDCEAMEAQPPDLDAIRAVLAAYAPPAREYRGPAFVFPEPLPDTLPARVEILADPARAPDLGAFGWLREASEAERPVAVVRGKGGDGGEIVSLCHSARRSGRAAEAGVETAPEHRGRGYGAAVVAAWAREVRRDGRMPMYSTWWENAASRALARRLGLVCYAEDLHIN